MLKVDKKTKSRVGGLQAYGEMTSLWAGNKLIQVLSPFAYSNTFLFLRPTCHVLHLQHAFGLFFLELSLG